MNALVGTQIEQAPSGWYFSTKLSIGFSYFSRLFIDSLVFISTDVMSLFLSIELAALVGWVLGGDAVSSEWLYWLLPFWAAGAAIWGLCPGWGLSAVESLRRQVILCFVVFAATGAAMFLRQPGGEYSWYLAVLASLFAIPLIPFLRMLAKRFLIRHGLWGVPVAVYGGGHAGRRLIRCLQDEPGQGYYPVCIFDDDPNLQGTTVEGVPVRGKTDSIAANDVPVAILTMTKISSARITELMESSLSSYLRVMIIPHLIHTPWLWATTRDLSGLPSLELTNNLLDPTKRVLKRSFELGLTYATLPFWGPVCGLLAALIWLEDRTSPVFKQRRIGQGGAVFETLKFRTMVPDAETVLKQKLEEDPDLRAEWEKSFKLKKDPRITRMGKFLRKTSLDEIPQLINVLRGEMSLIGPRPLPRYHYDQLSESVLKLRKRVKPGMTGLWQVSGRSDAGNEGMELWDPYYVRNWSLWLDIVILVRTVRVVLLGSGAR